MKIFFISQYFPPDITAAAFRISETASILKDDGFEVGILTAVPHKTHIKSCTDGEFDTIRVPVYRKKGENVGGYLLNYLSFMVNSFLWGLAKIPSDVDHVIVTSPPLFVGLSGWLLARMKRAKFILDIRDIWPDSAVGTGHLGSKSLLFKVAKLFEKFIYRRADIITCVSEKMREYIRTKIKKDVPVVVLYNGLSRKFLSGNLLDSDTDNNSKDGFSICYVGNIGYAQKLDLITETAKEFEGQDVRFMLVGDGAFKSTLTKRAAALGLDNVIFKDACLKQKAFEYMSQAHALLIILNNQCEAFNLTIPSKVFDCLWANRPILFAIEGEGREILSSLPGNLYFDSQCPESLAKAISELRNNYDFYSKNASGNRDFVLANYTREKTIGELEQYLK